MKIHALMEMYQVDTTGYEKGGYGSEVLLAVDGVLEGFVIVADEIKTDAAASVSKMKALGIATVMLLVMRRTARRQLQKRQELMKFMHSFFHRKNWSI